MPVLPAVELLESLLPAFGPCAAFQCECAAATWCPEKGFVPRGFLGAIGSIRDVRLVLLTAEPGDPLTVETYYGSPLEMLGQAHQFYYDLVERCRDQKGRNLIFHRNIRQILDLAWPGAELEEQLRRTWITDAYLCSAPKEGGPVRRSAEHRCASDYLHRELALFPASPLVIALGGKAKARADRIGINAHRVVSAAPPGCHQHQARNSWEEIPRLLDARPLTSYHPGAGAA